jgi:hypothetical protein
MPEPFKRRFLSYLHSACVSHRISRSMRWAEQYVAEAVLTTASVWAAYVLITPPSNFASFPASFAFVESLQGHEAGWAIIALLGATMKAGGLALLWRARTVKAVTISYYMRCFGLIISGFFWGLMGLSALIGNPDSLFGIWGILGGITAWWILIRFPVLPEKY